MSKASRLFRNEIPDDVVLRIFNVIGISSFSDGHWWSKHVLTPEICQELDNLYQSLEEYYYPHKHFLIKRNMTTTRYIQVIRQLAKAKGIVLESKEYKDKTRNRKKLIMYRLKVPLVMNKENFTVDFS